MAEAVGLTIVAIAMIAGGLAWCRLWPREADRMHQLFWVWVLMAVGPAIYWGAYLVYGPLPF